MKVLYHNLYTHFVFTTKDRLLIFRVSRKMGWENKNEK